MGQLWRILNLDKRQMYNDDPEGTLGEVLRGDYTTLFLLLATTPTDPQNPFHASPEGLGNWAGDRIICCGDHICDYPEGMLTVHDLSALPVVEGMRQYGGVHLYEFAQETYEVISHNDAIHYLPQYATYVPGHPWVLRNLSKREYVDSEAIEIAEDANEDRLYRERRPHIAEALLCRICWSSDSNISMGYKPLWPGSRHLNRGAWAGDRFDIMASKDFDRTHGGWKDVSDAFRREVFDVWASQCGDHLVDSWSTRASQAQKSVDAPFPQCNLDIIRYIMETAARVEMSDALCLARVSKIVNRWITPIIYHSIVLKETRKVNSFCITLDKKLQLGSKIRRLFCNKEVEPGVFKAALRHCTHLEHLVTNINIETLAPDEDAPSVESPWPILQHVMAIPDTYILPDKDHPLLHNITHLHVDVKELHTLATLLPVCLPHLTHLALFCPVEVSAWFRRRREVSYRKNIEDVVKSNPSFKVVLLIPYDHDLPKVPLKGDRLEELALIKDERLLARRGLDFGDYENIMKHGESLFADAETEYKNWRDVIHPSNSLIEF